MKKILFIFFLVFSAQLWAQKVIPKPNPPRLVVDNASLLNKNDATQLEKKLVQIDDNTSNQITILTINTLNGESLEEVAHETFRAWGIGNKKTQNGVLLLIAMQEKKIRIEVGYGLEGAIPDVTAKDIIEKNLKPAFRQGNYYSGINAAVDDIAKAAIGEYKIKRTKSKSGNGGSIIGIIIILIVLFIIIGRGGGRNGGMMSRRGYGSVADILFWNAILNAGRGGGGSNSGGWGDSDGGGFGGFGGGDSGGGGASGGW